jgi:DNA-binding response OmpR family regulator/HAMP domain-containing protein
MAKVLLVEDDATIRTGVVRALTGRGHVVVPAGNAMEGIRLAVAEAPDVVLLDLGLPDLDGREVLRMLRAVSAVPIIVVTARRTEGEMVRALDAGADDYVVKPYGAEQIDARIRAVLRRSAQPADLDPAIEVDGLRIDPRARTASLQGRGLELTPREFDLLFYLASRPGQVVGKRELLTEVWQVPYTAADKTVDVHLSWLRRKLGETAQEPRRLHTVRRVGVRFGLVAFLVPLGAVLLLLGVAVADRLAVAVVRPIRTLARVSEELSGGELDRRAPAADGPPEVRAVAAALNRLAGRIRDLLRQERESVADLSHRMRTPMTALRLDAEGLRDPAEAARILDHVDALDRAVTAVIEDARRERGAPSCDAAAVVAERVAFWAVLAEDQGRAVRTGLDPGPLPVAAAAADLAAAVDALLGNVFAHTEEGADPRDTA